MYNHSTTNDTINVDKNLVASQINKGLFEFLSERNDNAMLCTTKLSRNEMASIEPVISSKNCQLFFQYLDIDYFCGGEEMRLDILYFFIMS